MALRRIRSWPSAALTAALVAFGTSASAAGITRVQQSDGSVQIYRDVRMSLTGETLWIKSADRQGALEIVGDACFFVGQLQRCLASAVTLHQHGRTRSISLDRGTVYLNLTDEAHRLRHSSRLLPAHNVLVSLHTIHGTYVSVRGTLDDVKP
jgi:hypothetical protein